MRKKKKNQVCAYVDVLNFCRKKITQNPDKKITPIRRERVKVFVFTFLFLVMSEMEVLLWPKPRPLADTCSTSL